MVEQALKTITVEMMNLHVGKVTIDRNTLLLRYASRHVRTGNFPPMAILAISFSRHVN